MSTTELEPAPIVDAYEWVTAADGWQYRTGEMCEHDAGRWVSVTRCPAGTAARAWSCRRHGLEGQ